MGQGAMLLVGVIGVKPLKIAAQVKQPIGCVFPAVRH